MVGTGSKVGCFSFVYLSIQDSSGNKGDNTRCSSLQRRERETVVLLGSHYKGDDIIPFTSKDCIFFFTFSFVLVQEEKEYSWK